jgi:hypothetical protein
MPHPLLISTHPLHKHTPLTHAVTRENRCLMRDLAISSAVRDGLAATSWRLLVGVDVELDEETEVAREERATEDSGTLSAGAGAHGREPEGLPAGLGSKVRVG